MERFLSLLNKDGSTDVVEMKNIRMNTVGIRQENIEKPPHWGGFGGFT